MSSEFTANRITPRNRLRVKLMEGYPQITANTGETVYTEKFLIRSVDVPLFIDECTDKLGVSAGATTVILPAMHFQNLSPWLASEIDLRPFPDDKPGDPFSYNSGESPGSGSAAPAGTYTHLYTATVTYRKKVGGTSGVTPEEQDPTDVSAIATHTMSGGGQVITILPEKVAYKVNNWTPLVSSPPQDTEGRITANNLAFMGETKGKLDKNVALAKAIPTIEHTVSFPYLANPNWAFIAGQLGTVNDSVEGHVFSNDWPRFSDAYTRPNTILYASFNATEVFPFLQETGLPATTDRWYSVQMRFSERLVFNKYEGTTIVYYGWNHIWNNDQQKWVYPVLENNRAMYRETDFSLLRQSLTNTLT